MNSKKPGNPSDTREKGSSPAGSNVSTVQEKLPRWKGFRYAMCNESMQGMKWKEQCELLAQTGFQGIEIAPFTLVEKSIEEITPRKRKAMAAAMKSAGIECVGLHWLLSPPPEGLHVTTPDGKTRERSWNYFHQLIDFCADLGGKLMVFGSPKGRNTVKGLSVQGAIHFLSEGLSRAAEHARARGVKILLEPLGSNQTDVLNTTEEVVRLLEEIRHPALQTMFDFHNTTDEKSSFEEIISQNFSRIHHVHVQEMDGNYLGAGNGSREFLNSFQTLKNLGYEHWISLEVFDFSAGPKTIAKESMRALKTIGARLK